MGVLLKVQPMFVSSTQKKKKTGYTVLMDVPPRVQPVCLLALKPKEYITIMQGVLPKLVLGNTFLWL